MVNINFLSKTAALLALKDLNGGHPVSNRLLIAIPVEGETKSGIIIPTVADETLPKKGTVIQIGDMDYEMDIETGDLVTFGQYAGMKIERVNGVELTGFDLKVISVTEIIYVEKQD